MQKIKRSYIALIQKRLQNNPAVALLGARQVGKSTLARQIIKKYQLDIGPAVYLDLELESDRVKVQKDPELFFEVNRDALICLDEIQHLPNLFKVLRGVIDQRDRNGQFLILGSASRDLIKQSGESLAGRISYIEVNPFSRREIFEQSSFYDYWIRGGYPRSLLAEDDEVSFDWRLDYIRSFLERDIPSLGFHIPATTLNRFWTMLAHSHGQIINYAKLGQSLGVSGHTIKHYIDILEQTFIIRVLRPYYSNEKKRLIKSPKIYIRDSGLLHTLLKIENINDLLGHPVAGSSFEGLIIENILEKFNRYDAFFYRDSTGNEIDLVLVKGIEKLAFEIKLSKAPKLEKGFYHASAFLQPQKHWVISLSETTYLKDESVVCTNLDHLLNERQ